jgi:signal transduction histidine kinase
MMRRLSLHARLIAIAAITSVAALAFAAVSIGHVLERFVVHGLDRTLDVQIEALSGAVDDRGRLDRKRVIEVSGFRWPHTPWSWQVRTRAGVWTGGAAGIHVDHVWQRHRNRPILSGEGTNPAGAPLHVRISRYASAAGPVEIMAAAPRTIIDRPLASALRPLLVSLALLAGGLALATWVQLRYGLRPLRALGRAVADVRSGTAGRLPDDQPRELKPLADEVNALIAQNEAGLDHARRHLSNLAHGLKTPLATLSLQLAREEASAEARALVDQLDQRIAHHLRRARSAAPGGAGRMPVGVAQVAGDLVEALRHIHAERRLTIDIAVDPDANVAMDRQDVDEILGNLLDNACRHASERVRIQAAIAGAMTRITIEDDGPGLTEQQVDEALRPGRRLDESGTGYGFGLAITRELVELYGGTLALNRSQALGGLWAELTLPRR